MCSVFDSTERQMIEAPGRHTDREHGWGSWTGAAIIFPQLGSGESCQLPISGVRGCARAVQLFSRVFDTQISVPDTFIFFISVQML